MKKPGLDIPESGWVPSHVQVFRLKLPCTGVVSAEVRVLLNINITAVNRKKHQDVSLVFRRIKICLKTTDMLLDSMNGNRRVLDSDCVEECVVCDVIYVRNSFQRSRPDIVCFMRRSFRNFVCCWPWYESDSQKSSESPEVATCVVETGKTSVRTNFNRFRRISGETKHFEICYGFCIFSFIINVSVRVQCK